MGFIDSDAHVMENNHTWEFFDPDERDYAPKKVNGFWEVGDLVSMFAPFDPDTRPDKYNDLFPRGSVDLSDPSARIRRMDELGVDVQVLFPTWWLVSDVSPPEIEAALARSWNRWMAECTADSGGRLRWALQVPIRTPERALEELEFGREHGAVAVNLRGVRYGMGAAHQSYLSLYERAQDLDLTIAFHVGGDVRALGGQPDMVFLNSVAPVAGAFYSVVGVELPERFPRLRWAFLEAGASWLPFTIQEVSRADNSKIGTYRNFSEWRSGSTDFLERQNLFVACQTDDDLPYLIKFVGDANLVHGTDYGHLDLGSDPYGLQIVATRADVDSETLRRIVDDNGRRLWNIDHAFTPAPRLANSEVPSLEAIPDWIRKVQA